MARIAAIDTAQAADLLVALRLALRRRIVGECVKCSGGVLQLERWRRWLQVLADGMRVGCNPSRVNRASVAALVVCVQDSKQESTQEEKCSVWPVLGANSCGVYVARWLSLHGVGMRGLYGTLDIVYSVGVLRLLSMRRANTISSKVARLYVLRFYVTRCMRGGIYGRTYGALSFAHGIG